MAIPASKAELLNAITISFDKLIKDLMRVPPDLAREATLEGHASQTVMSPADLVAYLLRWNELVLKWLDRDDRGKPVDFPETGFQWNQLGLLAQKFYTDYQTLSWPDLLAHLTQAKGRLVETIILRSDNELYERPWHGKWTKGRMIQFNTSSPYGNARSRIRKWLRSQG